MRKLSDTALNVWQGDGVDTGSLLTCQRNEGSDQTKTEDPPPPP